MSHVSAPWYTHTSWFLTFFTEYPKALKAFCAALLSIPESQIFSCALRSPAFPEKSYPSFHPSPPMLSVSIFCSRTIHIDIFPNSPSITPPDTDRTISLLPSSVPLLPDTPFLRVYLLNTHQMALYCESLRHQTSCTTRFFNLFPSLPPLSHTTLYDLSRLLLLHHSMEIPALMAFAPSLTSIAMPLKEYLRDQEISFLFYEQKKRFASDGIQAMCTLNRLLIREQRITDLWNASEDPEILMELFREYHEKGYF